MRFKALLAVVALALGFTGTATAQVQDGSAADGTLFLTVFDPIRGETYNVDLGTSISDYLAAPTGFAADAGLATWLGGASDPGAILFDVGLVNFGDGSDLAAGTFGALITANGVPDAPADFSFGSTLLQNMQSYVAGINGSIANANSIATSGAGYFADPFTWNGNVGQALGGTTTGGAIDSAIALYSILATPTGAGQDWVVEQVTSLVLNGDGSLSIIPIPAAGWLLLSALAGLVGIARRRRAALA